MCPFFFRDQWLLQQPYCFRAEACLLKQDGLSAERVVEGEVFRCQGLTNLILEMSVSIDVHWGVPGSCRQGRPAEA